MFAPYGEMVAPVIRIAPPPGSAASGRPSPDPRGD
jgi:hypothetical protein